MGNLFELFVLGMTLALAVLASVAPARNGERMVASKTAPLAERDPDPGHRDV